jgi:hypothetical protein
MADAQALVLRGKQIRQDVNGHFCLDDIWEAAKSGASQLPKHWRGQGAVKRLEAELQKKVIAGYLKENKEIIPVAYANRGRGNKGTYAHPILAAAYAGYLSPKLEIEVREVWIRYRAGDAALADEILQRATPTDNEWAAVRAMARSKRVGYTETLKNHGVHGRGYPQCTNAIYRQILQGSAAQIRARKNLPRKANLRDNMETDELSYVMAAEVLATDRIKEEKPQGNDACAVASSRSAGFIREAIERDKRDRQKGLLK